MDTLPFSQRPNRSPRAAHPDAALEFHSEQTLSRGPERGGDPTRWLAHLAVVVVLLVAGVWGYRTYMNRPPPTGILRIESEPSEAAVDINGSLRGLTPFRTTLKPGRYAVVVTDADRSQSLTVQVEPGVEAVHHVRLTRPRPAAPGPGRHVVAADLAVHDQRRLAVRHQADVGRGAAHVERDQVFRPGEARGMDAAGDAAGWSR
jgi:hypothetical protein